MESCFFIELVVLVFLNFIDFCFVFLLLDIEREVIIMNFFVMFMILFLILLGLMISWDVMSNFFVGLWFFSGMSEVGFVVDVVIKKYICFFMDLERLYD